MMSNSIEKTEVIEHQSTDLTNLLHSIHQFMPKQETQNESDVASSSIQTESAAIDVTKLTLKEKRRALKLMKERQLLSEFELAKKNEMICEQVNNKKRLILGARRLKY